MPSRATCLIARARNRWTACARTSALSPDGRWRWHWDPRFLEGESSVNAQWRGGGGTPASLCLGAVGSRCCSWRGGASELVTPEAAQAFLELAPHAHYVDVAQARHMVAG